MKAEILQSLQFCLYLQNFIRIRKCSKNTTKVKPCMYEQKLKMYSGKVHLHIYLCTREKDV